MSPYKLVLVSSAALLLNATSCVSKDLRKSSTADRNAALTWEDVCIEQARQASATHVWCLTSAGSYIDAGQIFIFSNNPTVGAYIDSIPGGAQRIGRQQEEYDKIAKRKLLKEEEWRKLHDGLSKAHTYSAYSTPSFDGVEYRFIYAVANKDRAFEEKNNIRILPLQADDPQAKKYRELIDLVKVSAK